MTPETLLAKALTTPDHSDRILSEFFADQKPEPIGKMREAVSAMRRQVDESIKTSSPEELAVLVDAWGRKLAHEDWEKNAAILDDVGRAAKTGIDFAKKTGPITRAVAGGLVGGRIAHNTAPNEQYVDQHGNVKAKGKKLRTLTGMAVGAAAGAATHPTGRAYMGSKIQQGVDKVLKKTSNVSDLELMRSMMEKNALNLSGAWNAAKAVGGGLVSKAAPYAMKGLQAAKGLGATDPVKRGLIGAGAGAAVGAARHFMKPKDPQTGQRQGSMVGSMIGHGLAGGAIGVAAPHAAGMAMDTEPVKRVARGEAPFARKPGQLSLPLKK